MTKKKKSELNVQPVLIFTKKFGDKDKNKKPFSKVYSKESDNQSHFPMSCFCIQTGKTISKLNVFSNRDRAEGGIPKKLMIKNNTLFTEADNEMTAISKLQIHLITLCYDIDI